MFAMSDILHGNFGALWQAFQAPLIGALVALAGVLAGRWLRWPLVLAAAGPIGVCVGWLMLARSPVAATGAAAGKLLPIGLAGAVLCPLAARLLPRHGAMICLALLALGGGWWLAGAPRQLANAVAIGFLFALLVLALGLGGRFLARSGPWGLILAAIGLAGALWVAKAPPVWLLLALAPALVSVAVLLAPAATEFLLLPVAIDLLATALALILAAGRLPRLGVNAIDVAALAPFLAALLAPRLRLSPPLAGIAAASIAIFLAWGARMWLSG